MTVFLSYARSDDESFVARLHSDLTARGFEVWWDHASMPARGLTFLHEIRDAIEASARFLLVLGPKATTSDYVVAEWQYALTYGKAINAVLRLGDFPLVPPELKLFHIEDFRDDVRYAFHFENLVRQLSEPVAPMGRLVGLPSLPRNYLSRSELLGSLKEILLSDLQRAVAVTGAAAWVGVHGMGGIGKSVLANLLARNNEVRRAFPEGILWLPLGTDPNVVELQRNVAKVFGDPGNFDNAAQGRVALSELFSTRAILFVLDDVWERAHVEAFNVLGPRCQAVITTRDSGLVTSLGAKEYQLHVLTEAESLILLADATGQSPELLPPEAKEIAFECGFLPLAIALCGAMVRELGWQDVIERLKKSALQLVGSEHPQYEHHRNLWTAMKVSIDALNTEEQERFVELSVFPNDETVPEATVRALWSHTGGLSRFKSQDLITKLSQRSLIRLDTETPRAGEASRRRLSLHNLLYDFVITLAGDPRPLQNQILDAYRKHCPTGWCSGPDDGWFLQRLRYHFEVAGKMEEFANVLLNLRWLERKNGLGLTFDLVEDFSAALRALTSERSIRKKLHLLNEALRRDVHFIARHSKDYPQALFQCLWNSCWWYDCEEAKAHYQAGGPWQRKGPKLHILLESWRKMKEKGVPRFTWLRSLRPPPMRLGTGLQGVFDLAGSESAEFCVSSNASRLLAYSDDSICVWDLDTGRELFYQAKVVPPQVAGISPDGRRFAIAFNDHRVSVWDVRTATRALALDVDTDAVTGICFSPDGTKICTGSKDGSVQVWSAIDGSRLSGFKGHQASVIRIVFSANGDRVVSASVDCTVRVLDVWRGMETHRAGFSRFKTGSFGRLISVDMSNGGSHAGAYRLEEGRERQPEYFVEIVDVSSGVLTRHHLKNGQSRSFALSPNGSQFAVGYADWTVELFSAASGEPCQRFRVHSGEVYGVAFAPNERYLLTEGATPDRTIKVWDLASRAAPVYLPTPWYGSMGIAFSADGTRVACDHGFEGTRLYDASTGILTTNDDETHHFSLLDEHKWPETYRRKYPDERWGNSRKKPVPGGMDATLCDSGVSETAILIPGGPAWLPFRMEYATPNPAGTVWAGAFDNYLCLYAIENGENLASAYESFRASPSSGKQVRRKNSRPSTTSPNRDKP